MGLPAAEARALTALGRVSRARGEYEQAAAELRAAWRAAERARAVEAELDALIALVSLVGVELGRPHEGLDLLGVAQAKLVNLPDDDERIARLHREAGLLAQRRAAYDEAAEHFQQAAARYAERFGEDDPRVAEVLGISGALHGERGQHQKAREDLERAREILEAAHGPEHPEVAYVINRIGINEDELGHLDLALEHFARSEAILRGALPGHGAVAQPINNAGNVLMRLGEPVRAADKFAAALSIKRAELGHDHPQLGLYLGNYARALTAAGNAAQALPLHRQALTLRRAELGDDHPVLGYSHLLLAEALFALGHHPEALAALDDAARGWDRHHGGVHPALAEVLTLRGEVEAARGRRKAALASLHEAVAMHERLGPNADPRRAADTRFALARHLAATDPTMARAHAEAARRDYLRAVPDGSPELADVDAWLRTAPH
jgi:tetratricopeptide (TPR) repeat protein